MKVTILALLALVGVVNGIVRFPRDTVESGEPSAVGASLVSAINNNPQATFTARRYENFEGLTTAQLNHYLGAIKDPAHEAAAIERQKRQIAESGDEGDDEASVSSPTPAPASFDVSQKWPQCKKVFESIQDQSSCGSCWAVSTAAAISDRRCIRYNGTAGARISAWDLVSCCDSCKPEANGCNGGYPSGVFEWYVSNGVVTGGPYSGGGCKPYPVAPNTAAPSTTGCTKTCQSAYTVAAYAKDQKKGGSSRIMYNNNTQVMNEILARGPVVATFDVYEDFYQYSTGVYKHTTGAYVGGHAVKIVGWGVDTNGVKYWRVANSWGSAWGEAGFFRIIRDTDDCNFESFISTGTSLKD